MTNPESSSNKLPPRLLSDVMLTTEQVAKLMQCHTRTVLNYRKRSGLPFVKLGKLVRFREAEYLEWVESREGNKRTLS